MIPNLATAFIKTVTRPLKKETTAKLKDHLKIPDNCREFRVPKMNNEIWKCLPPHAKMDDVHSQQVQTSLVYGLSSLSKIANAAALLNCRKDQGAPASKELCNEIIDFAIKGANFLGHQLQEMNLKRRGNVKRHINSDYSGICNREIPNSEWLFGTELAESLKQSKTASTIMKSSLRGNRFRPYNMQRSPSANLNFQRLPSYPQKRGNWNNRGRNVNRNQREQPFAHRPSFQPYQKYNQNN